MKPALIVIDDFLPDPNGFRDRAVRLDYRITGSFPGRNSVERIELEGLEQVVSAMVHERVRGPSPPESHGRCRLALASDDEPGKIHIDPSHWSGVLYLTRPEDCRGGTEFYRHIPTGTDRVPTDLTGLRRIGYSSYDELKQQIIEQDANDRSKWEHTFTVPMRFNRLVLLQPHYWHTSGGGFGTSVENGRLIYVMFFKRVAGAQY